MAPGARGAVGVVEQAGDEVGRPAADVRPSRSISASTSAGSQTSARSIGAPSSTGIRKAPSMPMKWPTGVAVSWLPRSAG